MTLYKIEIKDRLYSEWSVYKNLSENEKVDLKISPTENKLFNDDIFTYNKNIIQIIESPVRNSIFPAVLVLKQNKTYGRHQNGKMIYKCIPDDPKIPSFLVPYEMKNMGFSKVFTNLYVTICFSEWKEKHPCGIISQIIGPIDEIEHFYEYQLYCKKINSSLQKFTKATMKSLKDKEKEHNDIYDFICKKYSGIEDRTHWKVFSIDPEGSVDFDDAFSIQKITSDTTLLSIYISNVSIWIDVLDLWDQFTGRVSTIYLPDKKRTMLPTILSDNLCSLVSKSSRFAFTMDIYISNHSNDILDIKYSNTKIRLYKNFVYEESSLLRDENYHMLYFMVKNVLSKKYSYMDNITDSHDIVQYLMIFMNYFCAKELLNEKNGIFRTAIIKEYKDQNGEDIPDDTEFPSNVSKFLKMIHSYSGKYIDIDGLAKNESLRHDVLNMDAYIHITSPIRRLVDLLNMIRIQKNMKMIELSNHAYEFYDYWCMNIDYLNNDMKMIKRVQNDCNLLYLCESKPELLEKNHIGYAFSKNINSQFSDLIEYSVYLPEMNITTRVFTKDAEIMYKAKSYKLYLFQDEEKFKKKIRLQLQ